MKIAEALVRIKDTKGKLAQLLNEISQGQSYEQIDATIPIPSIDNLIKDYCDISLGLSQIKDRITRTNTKHGLQSKLYKMGSLRSAIKQLEGLTHAKQKVVRLSRVDYEGPAVQISTFATYNVENLIARMEDSRKEIRELDLELQRLNWEIDLED